MRAIQPAATAVIAHELGLLEGIMNIPIGTRPKTHIQIHVVRSRKGKRKNRLTPIARKIPRLTNRTVRAVAWMLSV